MSGCYFIHYPRKNHRHGRYTNKKHPRSKLQRQKQLQGYCDDTMIRRYETSRRNRNQSHDIVAGSNIKTETPVQNTIIQAIDKNSIIVVLDDDIIVTDNTNHLSGSPAPPSNMKHINSSSSSIISASSVSSISSNDDPTMKQLSIWNSMIHVVKKMHSTDDVDSS
jgi:hypothetical protein